MGGVYNAYLTISKLKGYRSFGIIIIYLIACIVCNGQVINFEFFTEDMGLISSKVTSVLKDSEGYIWIATAHGLDRYDGYVCKHFLSDANNSSSLLENNIRCLIETKEQKLYLGFNGKGLGVFNKRKETFEEYHHDPNDSSTLSNDVILTVFEDKNGIVWIGTKSGLDRFDPSTKKVTRFSPFEHATSNVVSSITADENGNLWVYGPAQKLCKFDPKGKALMYLGSESQDPKTLADSRTAILYDRNHTLWFGNPSEGLCHYNPSNGTTEKFGLQNEHLTAQKVTCLTEDSEGSIWIGTNGAGLFKYNPSKHSFDKFLHIVNNPITMSSNKISCVYESHPGIVWIGTESDGLNIWKKDKKKFYNFGINGKVGERLNKASVMAITPAGQNKVWIGTDGDGISLFDPKTFKFTYNILSKVGNEHASVKSIYTEANGTLWYGAFDKGLCTMDLNGPKSTSFQKDFASADTSVSANCAWVLCKTQDNKLWIGLLQGGVKVYDLTHRRFVDEFAQLPELTRILANRIQAIIQDSKGNIWIGTEENGVVWYNPDTKKYLNFKREEGNPFSITSNNIKTIAEDKNGTIWVGARGGLSKLVDFSKRSFITYTIADGLPTNHVKNIVEDKSGNLWLGTGNGISCFHVKEGYFSNFDMEDGLQGKNFHSNSYYQTSDGHIYMGGIDGFNYFHPDSLRIDTTPPALVFTDFKIFDRVVLPNIPIDGQVYLNESIDYARTIQLNHADNVFTVEFAALDFLTSHKNRYAYKLLGFNKDWRYVGSEHRSATYTNLDPGKYTLQVIACNSDGVWNKEGINLDIIIRPPYYLTWWFRTSIAGGFVVFVWLFFHIRQRNMVKLNKFLEAEVNKRTIELRESNEEILSQNEEILTQHQEIMNQKDALEASNKTKDKFFSIIGHDLKNPVRALNFLVQHFKEDLDKRNVPYNKDLHSHIEKSSTTIHNLVINLLEWAKTQTGSIAVNPVTIVAKELVREVLELTSEQANVKNISLEENAPEDVTLYADYNMVNTVIRNILSNSIKFTHVGGQILLSVAEAKGEARISIKDNGVGMSPETASKLFKVDQTFSSKGTNNETGTGLGMLITSEFVALNNGRIEVESEIGKGTTFHVFLPVAPKN